MVFNLELSFGPKWENISIIRNFIGEMLSFGIIERDEALSVATAISEAMENLVKYTFAGGAIIHIRKDANIGEVTMELTNIASDKDIDIFKNIYDDVYQGTPKEAYKRRMLLSLNNKGHSQLGLARIRYECGGDISYIVREPSKQEVERLGVEKELEASSLLMVKIAIPVVLSHDI